MLMATYDGRKDSIGGGGEVEKRDSARVLSLNKLALADPLKKFHETAYSPTILRPCGRIVKGKF